MKIPELDSYLEHPDKDTFLTMFNTWNAEHYSTADLGVPSRVMTHWKKTGILNTQEGREWVRLTVLDYFWVKVIEDLRSFGMSLQTIKKVKDQLFETIGVSEFLDELGEFDKQKLDKHNEFLFKDVDLKDVLDEIQEKDPDFIKHLKQWDVPMFHNMVIDLLTKNRNYAFLITNDGHVEVLGEIEDQYDKLKSGLSIEQVIAKMNNQPFVLISLRKYFLELISSSELYRKIEEVNPFEDVELEVLRAMRSNNLKELKIIFPKEGKYKDLVFTYTNTVPDGDISRVMDQFCGKKHAELKMKTSDGKTIHYEYQKRKRYGN